MTRVLAITLAVLMLLTLAAPPVLLAAQAQGTDSPVAEIILAGVVVLRVRVPAAGLDVYQRSEVIYQRLNEAIRAHGTRLQPDLVRVEVVRGTPIVYLGDHLIVSVDAAHAALNGSTPEALAAVWAGNLAKAVARYAAIHGF